jgi:hypothetical protein
LQDGPSHHVCACLLDVLDNNSFADAFEFYLFSLSRHEDDPQQWCEYGQKGRGFAIGFSPSLFAAIETTPKEQPTENLYVGRVVYGGAANEARHRRVITAATEITSRVAWANRHLSQPFNASDYFLAMAREVIASQLVWNCLTAKHDCYSNECEVRYMLVGVRAKFDGLRKVFNGKTYIEAPLPLRTAGSVTQILAGPNAPLDAEEMTSKLLVSLGYPKGIPVHRSRASG